MNGMGDFLMQPGSPGMSQRDGAPQGLFGGMMGQQQPQGMPGGLGGFLPGGGQSVSPQDQWQMTLQKLQAMKPKQQQSGGGLGDIIKLAMAAFA